MKLLKSWEIPINVISEANVSEHWTKSHKRRKEHKRFVKYFMSDILLYADLPVVIKLTRISPRRLDEHDNLPTSFKYVVDEIASMIFPGKQAGRADDTDQIEWMYAQEKGTKGVKVDLYKKNSE